MEYRDGTPNASLLDKLNVVRSFKRKIAESGQLHTASETINKMLSH